LVNGDDRERATHPEGRNEERSDRRPALPATAHGTKEPSVTHPGTADVIRRFNDAFVQRDPDVLVDLVADDCVMESTQPAPNGTRYEGYDACLRFWQELIADPNGSFEPEDVVV
jgi:hypothetical protein